MGGRPAGASRRWQRQTTTTQVISLTLAPHLLPISCTPAPDQRKSVTEIRELEGSQIIRDSKAPRINLELQMCHIFLEIFTSFIVTDFSF